MGPDPSGRLLRGLFPSGASIARSPQSARKTLVNAARLSAGNPALAGSPGHFYEPRYRSSGHDLAPIPGFRKRSFSRSVVAGKTCLLKELKQEMPVDLPATYLDFDAPAGGQRSTPDPAAALLRRLRCDLILV